MHLAATEKLIRFCAISYYSSGWITEPAPERIVERYHLRVRLKSVYARYAIIRVGLFTSVTQNDRGASMLFYSLHHSRAKFYCYMRRWRALRLVSPCEILLCFMGSSWQ